MQPIKVVLDTLPRLLGDIVVKAIGAQEDMTILSPGRQATLLQQLRKQPVDVLVTAAEGQALLALAEELLAVRPQMRILALNNDARQLHLCELRPVVEFLTEVSTDTLIDAIRLPGFVTGSAQ